MLVYLKQLQHYTADNEVDEQRHGMFRPLAAQHQHVESKKIS